MSTQLEIKDSSILYIEDDAITRIQLSKFFKSKCRELYTAVDGQEGYELFLKYKPDIVITDIEMPKLNGLEMARKIRANSLSTQIIIITAYKKDEYLLQAVNLQLTQYLLKPLSIEKITDALKLSSNYLNCKRANTKKIIIDNGFYDIYTKELVCNDQVINLSKYERALLELLIENYPAPTSYESIEAKVYDVSKLYRTINAAITPEMMEKLAKGSLEGRQLFVGATNMDYGQLRVWDLEQIASEKSSQKAIDQIVSILFASTAIPGLFPPVIIDDLLYVDGGATMQIVGGTDDRSWAYKTNEKQMEFVNSKAPIKIRIWIIVNQKLLTDAKVVQSRWTSIAARSLNTLIRASTLQSIQDLETYVQLIDSRPEFEAEMKYVAIPQDFPIADSDEMFDAKTMRDLVKLGLRMGADPTSWKTKALRPGAPFVLD